MIMKITEVKTTVLRASEGKVLRRISDQKVFGSELWLGYTYYLGNKKLDEPLWELPEHYEEVDAPEEFKNMINTD
nr:MAG TPA: hypothetical protein [Bacteriophage sp.]